MPLFVVSVGRDFEANRIWRKDESGDENGEGRTKGKGTSGRQKEGTTTTQQETTGRGGEGKKKGRGKEGKHN
jgi:hypothetical protein